MSEHTKGELWFTSTAMTSGMAVGFKVGWVHGLQGHVEVSPGDARRLVACWNAFDGISTEDIEAATPVRGSINRYNAALRQRDRLLEALTALVARCEFDGVPNDLMPVVDAARAAIAAAERGES